MFFWDKNNFLFRKRWAKKGGKASGVAGKSIYWSRGHKKVLQEKIKIKKIWLNGFFLKNRVGVPKN